MSAVARTIGICSRTGSAVAVAIEDATLLRRWTLDLTEGRVPAQPFHAAAGRDDAAAFIRRAVDTVTEVAERRLRELLAEVGPVAAVAVVTGDAAATRSGPASSRGLSRRGRCRQRHRPRLRSGHRRRRLRVAIHLRLVDPQGA